MCVCALTLHILCASATATATATSIAFPKFPSVFRPHNKQESHICCSFPSHKRPPPVAPARQEPGLALAESDARDPHPGAPQPHRWQFGFKKSCIPREEDTSASGVETELVLSTVRNSTHKHEAVVLYCGRTGYLHCCCCSVE